MASVFTKIIAGELPGHFVWKDDHCVAILTIEPIHPGHVLVIPRQEIDHWDDMPESLAAHVMVVAQRIAKAVKKEFPAERIGMMIAGLEVPHTHLHVLPINALGDLSFSKAQSASQEALAEAAQKIRSALRANGYANESGAA